MLDAWEKCVKTAKKRNGVTDKWTLIKGPVLRDAQKAYCAILTKKNVYNK
jgi:hypothetical protein